MEIHKTGGYPKYGDNGKYRECPELGYRKCYS